MTDEPLAQRKRNISIQKSTSEGETKINMDRIKQSTFDTTDSSMENNETTQLLNPNIKEIDISCTIETLNIADQPVSEDVDKSCAIEDGKSSSLNPSKIPITDVISNSRNDDETKENKKASVTFMRNLLSGASEKKGDTLHDHNLLKETAVINPADKENKKDNKDEYFDNSVNDIVYIKDFKSSDNILKISENNTESPLLSECFDVPTDVIENSLVNQIPTVADTVSVSNVTPDITSVAPDVTQDVAPDVTPDVTPDVASDVTADVVLDVDTTAKNNAAVMSQSLTVPPIDQSNRFSVDPLASEKYSTTAELPDEIENGKEFVYIGSGLLLEKNSGIGIGGDVHQDVNLNKVDSYLRYRFKDTDCEDTVLENKSEVNNSFTDRDKVQTSEAKNTTISADENVMSNSRNDDGTKAKEKASVTFMRQLLSDASEEEGDIAQNTEKACTSLTSTKISETEEVSSSASKKQLNIVPKPEKIVGTLDKKEIPKQSKRQKRNAKKSEKQIPAASK